MLSGGLGACEKSVVGLDLDRIAFEMENLITVNRRFVSNASFLDW